ncbi:MAG: hypothetical protein K0Q49_289 [Haloplasmataceae bacterium]|jgi:NTE family protein|nr:hypothetical protein [Haloplasmataceae bacterium]
MRINAFFEGGGILGIAFIGAYKALSERGYQIARCAGISVGSMVSALIMSGYSANELINIVTKTDFNIFKDCGKSKEKKFIKKSISAIANKGLNNSETIENYLNELLNQKGNKYFGDLMINGESTLKIIGANISNHKMLVLPDDLPHYGINPYNFEIAKAVRMSCSIPFYYTPVELDTRFGKNLIVDGGIVKNIPTRIISNSKLFKFPTFRFKFIRNSIMSKINDKINIINAYEENNEDAEHIILINIEKSIKSTDFDLTKEELLYLYKQGYKATVKYLNKLNNNF